MCHVECLSTFRKEEVGCTYVRSFLIAYSKLPHPFQQLWGLGATLIVYVINCQYVVCSKKAPRVWQEEPESQVNSVEHIDVYTLVFHRPAPMACFTLPHMRRWSIYLLDGAEPTGTPLSM